MIWFVAYHVGLLLLSGFVAASIARPVFRLLNARRDRRTRARNGDSITLNFEGQALVVASRLPKGFPGCESCAREAGVPVPENLPGTWITTLHCPGHYDEFCELMRVAWKRRQDAARRDA